MEGSLPDGDYTLLLSHYAESASFAVLAIHVADAPFESAPVALAPGISIPVRVEKQFTQPDNSARPINVGAVNVGNGKPQTQPVAQIYLSPLDTAAGSANSKPGPDGEVELDGVPPGQYTVHASGLRGYVASLTCAGVAQGFASEDGKFQVPNVAPGSYQILAFRGNYQQIAFRDRRLLKHGMARVRQ